MQVRRGPGDDLGGGGEGLLGAKPDPKEPGCHSLVDIQAEASAPGERVLGSSEGLERTTLGSPPALWPLCLSPPLSQACDRLPDRQIALEVPQIRQLLATDLSPRPLHDCHQLLAPPSPTCLSCSCPSPQEGGCHISRRWVF